jgi:FKBP12-rapamycin complex-associated protein
MDALQIEMQSRLPGKDQAELEDEPPGRAEPQAEGKQQINEKAVKALQRVKQKLRGCDFEGRGQLSVEDQVGRLIQEATSPLNICQSWPGWCPFW